MEAGTTPWRREWDASTCGYHLNLLTGHRYRGSNPVLLTLGMHLRGSNTPALGPLRVRHPGLRTFTRTRKR
jgi:antirestriction protein ArdC